MSGPFDLKFQKDLGAPERRKEIYAYLYYDGLYWIYGPRHAEPLVRRDGSHEHMRTLIFQGRDVTFHSEQAAQDFVAAMQLGHGHLTRVTNAGLNTDNVPPISEPDQARALHRVIRAMHDGHCPNCFHLAPSEEFQRFKPYLEEELANRPPLQPDGHECPNCGFSTTLAEEQAGLELFHKYFHESLLVFKAWQASRQEKACTSSPS